MTEVLTAGQAAKLCGVPKHVLRELDNKGILVAERTESNHRQYSAEAIKKALKLIPTSQRLDTERIGWLLDHGESVTLIKKQDIIQIKVKSEMESK